MPRSKAVKARNRDRLFSDGWRRLSGSYTKKGPGRRAIVGRNSRPELRK